MVPGHPREIHIYIHMYVRIPLRMAIHIVTKRSEIVRTMPTINICKMENLWLKVLDKVVLSSFEGVTDDK